MEGVRVTAKENSSENVTLEDVFMFALMVPAVWALAILAVQCITWLKFGIWQPVPAYALFLSPEAKVSSLRLTESGISALDLVPPLASYNSPNSVVADLCGRMVGMSKIVGWLLDCSFGGWLVCLEIAAVWALIACADSMRNGRAAS
jgi:hypothetical protein